MHKVEFSLRDTGLAESSPYALPPGSPTETRAQSTRMSLHEGRMVEQQAVLLMREGQLLELLTADA